MANEFYDHTTYPAAGSFGTSSGMRAEFDNVEAGFDKLPTMAGNGGEVVAVNSGGTALEAITTTGTGSGVRATSPTLTTPILSNAALTGVVYSQQPVHITHSGTGAMLATDILDGIIRSTGGTPTLTLPTGADLAAAASSQLAVNRSFEFSVIHAGAGTLTVALAASGWTNVGSLTVAAGTSGLFRVRCTNTATYILYRLA